MLASGSLAANAAPQSIPGLAAWYKIDSLWEKMRDGEVVQRWPDSSGNEHHLASDNNGPRAEFRKLRIGKKPVVHVQEMNTFSVARPVELRDHTIFVVYSADDEECALFQSSVSGEDGFGIVLRDGGTRDYLKVGQRRQFYNTPLELGDQPVITLLGRESGRLRSFVNGVDVSADSQLPGTVRVGRFFRLSLTRAVKVDGQGLEIAEMIFFDRWLTPAERATVTEYLSEKYAIATSTEVLLPQPDRPEPIRPPDQGAAQVVLGSDSAENLNQPEPGVIAWNLQRKTGPPFRHDPETDGTRLYGTRDGTRLQLYVSLALATSVDGIEVRVLLLKNNQEYLPDEAISRPIEAGRAQAQLAATLVLDDGDFVEVITVAAGAAGRATLVPEGSVLVATVEEPQP